MLALPELQEGIVAGMSGPVHLYVLRACDHIRCADPDVLSDAVDPFLYHPCCGILCPGEPDLARIPGLVVPYRAPLWALNHACLDPCVIRALLRCEEDISIIEKYCLDCVLGLPRLRPWPCLEKLQVIICSMA